MSYFEELDLHGLSSQTAKSRLDEMIRKLPRDVRELTVIHGYHGGTAIRDMVRRYKNPRVEKKILGLNQGSTVFIIKP